MENKERLGSSGIGGQAVIEGIMMRNKDKYAVAVRKPDKSIDVDIQECGGIAKKYKITTLPFIRGIFSFIDSMVIGIKTLTYSASFFEDDELMNYTIPRNNRELQPVPPWSGCWIDYTIPRNNRELQHRLHEVVLDVYYTIPRNNRELQLSLLADVASIYYTIPRNNRELQRAGELACGQEHYTIPRNNRELQPLERVSASWSYYTIPRNNRELQHNKQVMRY